MSYEHIYTRIPLHNFDLGGVLHHASYLLLLEDLRERYMESRKYPYSRVMKEGLHLPIVRAEQKFKAPITYGEIISSKLWVTLVSTTRYSLTYELTNSKDKLCHICETDHACVRTQGGQMKVTGLPKELLSIFEADIPSVGA